MRAHFDPRQLASDRCVSLMQGLAQSVQLRLDANPVPDNERPAITRRIVVWNQKSGLGKTAISAGLCEALAEDPDTLQPVRAAKALTRVLRASETPDDEAEPADHPLDIENLPGVGLRVLLVNGTSPTNWAASETCSSPSTTMPSTTDVGIACPPATTPSCSTYACPRYEPEPGTSHVTGESRPIVVAPRQAALPPRRAHGQLCAAGLPRQPVGFVRDQGAGRCRGPADAGAGQQGA